MKVVTVDSFTVTVHVGLKCRATGLITDRVVVLNAIQKYVDSVGLCVSVTFTDYLYSGGNEPGVVVGLINYPRFPLASEQIRAHALVIAEVLLKLCKQLKATIVTPIETVMIDNYCEE